MGAGMKETLKSIAVGAAIGLGIAIVFVIGFITRDILNSSLSVVPPPNHSVTFPLLSEVVTYVERFYLRQLPDETEREYAAIRGVLAGLSDPHTYFIAPVQTQMESDFLAGVYGGIGVKVQRTTTGQFRLTPFDDSPAQTAGIQDGDILLSVQGQDIMQRTEAEVEILLRGEVKENSGVNITVEREGQTQALFVPFGVIQTPSVFSRVLEENSALGYLQITSFTNRTPSEVRDAAKKLADANVKAIIVDLRSNGGGLLQEALEVAGEFVDNGTLLIERRRDGEQTYSDTIGGVLTTQPLAVLINPYTASASEVVAGVIRDYRRGIFIGQKTYGKGTIQQILALSDGSSIHLTYAEWLTPLGIALDGRGIEPDYTLPISTTGADTELAAAIEIITGLIAQE
jgi:carboxyl-terminal processing protease